MKQKTVKYRTGLTDFYVLIFFVNNCSKFLISCLDKLKYAGNIENINYVENKKKYKFLLIDMFKHDYISKRLKKYNFESEIHLALEYHLYRSISNPLKFVKINILGTVNFTMSPYYYLTKLITND